MSDLERLLREQWTALVGWLHEVDVVASAGRPSGLAGWDVGDLVAHLGYGIAMIGEVESAPADLAPIDLRRYVAGYDAAASVIDLQTRQLRRRLEPDLVRGIDLAADRAWAGLRRLSADVVVGRRGPLTRDDYLRTRLIEVVVHGDDLGRALALASPLQPAAIREVAATLATAHLEAGGAMPVGVEARAWIRRATGRAVDPAGGPPVLS